MIDFRDMDIVAILPVKIAQLINQFDLLIIQQIKYGWTHS